MHKLIFHDVSYVENLWFSILFFFWQVTEHLLGNATYLDPHISSILTFPSTRD